MPYASHFVNAILEPHRRVDVRCTPGLTFVHAYRWNYGEVTMPGHGYVTPIGRYPSRSGQHPGHAI